MSGRAKVFVEFWISEFIHPDTHEDEARTESRVSALACVKSAALNGIAKPEIDEEYGDLTAYIAAAHEQIVEAELRRQSGSAPEVGDWAASATLFLGPRPAHSLH